MGSQPLYCPSSPCWAVGRDLEAWTISLPIRSLGPVVSQKSQMFCHAPPQRSLASTHILQGRTP